MHSTQIVQWTDHASSHANDMSTPNARKLEGLCKAPKTNVVGMNDFVWLLASESLYSLQFFEVPDQLSCRVVQMKAGQKIWFLVMWSLEAEKCTVD